MKRTVAFRCLAVAAMLVASPLLPVVTRAASTAAITYTGTVSIASSNRGKHEVTRVPLSITIDGNQITNYSFSSTLQCPDGSVINQGIASTLNEHDPLQSESLRHLSRQPSVRQRPYRTCHRHGHDRRVVTGHIRFEAHEDESVTPAGPICTSSYSWTPKAQAPPAPSVSMGFTKVSLPNTPPQQYALGVGAVSCSNGAVAAQLTVDSQSRTVTCQGGSPIVTVIATGLTTGRIYTLTTQPLIRHNRQLIPAGPARISFVRMQD